MTTDQFVQGFLYELDKDAATLKQKLMAGLLSAGAAMGGSKVHAPVHVPGIAESRAALRASIRAKAPTVRSGESWEPFGGAHELTKDQFGRHNSFRDVSRNVKHRELIPKRDAEVPNSSDYGASETMMSGLMAFPHRPEKTTAQLRSAGGGTRASRASRDELNMMEQAHGKRETWKKVKTPDELQLERDMTN